MDNNKPSFSASNVISVNHYDLIVIGGGIAGVAVTELLSRLTSLRILVLEREAYIGTGSSGRLEGWYHSGALYAGLQDPQTFFNCTNALKTCYNLYGYGHHRGFNGELIPLKGVTVPRIRRLSDQTHQDAFAHLPERWFNPHPVYYIMPSEGAPDFQRTPRRPFDRFFLWQQQRTLMLLRLMHCFIEHDWKDADDYCTAPTLQGIEDAWIHSDREGVPRIPDVFGVEPAAKVKLSEFCRNYSGTDGATSYEFYALSTAR